ncbi:small subunit rRNA maturation protein LCP5 [Sporobolomyces salmoneus]|uniref:small subunit rRNA maturation protein LCP5 n=1 Tax=Sporobolomyces salmoneus TaxID=183962 RepID=UPI0031710734
MSSPETSDISPSDLDQVRSLLSDVRLGAQSVREAAQSWKDRLQSTSELNYPSGISLLSLKNHLLLSYLHHLVALFALKLSSTSLTSTEGNQVVGSLVKLRVVLEKVAPLEQKLKYQVEKLVRKADQAAEGADEQDVLNDPLAFRPNPSNLVLDRTASEDEDNGDDRDEDRSGVYRPPRLAAMPYVEAPLKGKKSKKRDTPSHLVHDMSAGLSSSTPYGETTTGLSVSHDPSLQSGTARHLKRVEDYEMDHFTRMRMSKKDAKRRRAEEEEVAFGGLGAGKGGKRRLGGFGAEFDDLLGGDRGGERKRGEAYDQMRGMKKQKIGGTAKEKDYDGVGSSGLTGGSGGAKRTKNKFDKAVSRSRG